VGQARVTQPPQRLFFQLADTFPAEAEFVGDFFQCMGFATPQAETQP
jgi:hypothetical protein